MDRSMGRLMHSYRKDRLKLPCRQCGRRIAWWDIELRHGPLGLIDGKFRGWKWQGERPVLRFGEDGWITDVDWEDRRPVVRFVQDLAHLECQSCGAIRTARQPYPIWWRHPPELL